FDLPYLLKRSETLGIAEDAMRIGRIRGQRARGRPRRFESKAYGRKDTLEIRLTGRVCLDMHACIRRDHKLRSYSLNAVCAHFLKMQKNDVHHSTIATLHDGDANTRQRLALYCLKDARLPLFLEAK